MQRGYVAENSRPFSVNVFAWMATRSKFTKTPLKVSIKSKTRWTRYSVEFLLTQHYLQRRFSMLVKVVFFCFCQVRCSQCRRSNVKTQNSICWLCHEAFFFPAASIFQVNSMENVVFVRIFQILQILTTIFHSKFNRIIQYSLDWMFYSLLLLETNHEQQKLAFLTRKDAQKKSSGQS